MGFGKSKRGKRPPLKQRALHNPGDSIREEIDRVIYHDLMRVMVCTMFVVVFAGLEWLRFYRDDPPNPMVMSVFAVLAIVYFLFKSRSGLKQLRALALGMEGEKIVGQQLESLREKGCRVFHDIVGDGFNIDHVVVSEHGVYVIETKTYSKPNKGVVSAEFDGEKILIGGYAPDRNAATQVRALSKWLQDMLIDTTGRKFPVRGVVLLPGWYVEKVKKKTDIWVLNPKALSSFIGNEPVLLSSEDVALISSRIVTYMQDW